MIVATCQRCGAEFQARRRSARFCGDTCRQQAHREGSAAVAVVATPAEDEDPGLAGPALGDGDVAPPPVPHLQVARGPVDLAESLGMLSFTARRLVEAIDAASDPRELAALAGRLPTVLKALRAPAARPAAGPSPPNRLQQLRDARAALDAKSGHRT